MHDVTVEGFAALRYRCRTLEKEPYKFFHSRESGSDHPWQASLVNTRE